MSEWPVISFVLPPNEYGCVCAWTALGNIATDRLTEDAEFGQKKSSFQMKLILFLAAMLTSKIVPFWGTENPHTYIEKPTHPKLVTILVRILVQTHKWTIILRK